MPEIASHVIKKIELYLHLGSCQISKIIFQFTHELLFHEQKWFNQQKKM